MRTGGQHHKPSIGNDVSARPSREAGAGEVPPAALAPADILAELNRVKCLFQLRAISTVIGIPPWIADDQAFEDAASEHANRVALACPGELIAPHSQTDTAEA